VPSIGEGGAASFFLLQEAKLIAAMHKKTTNALMLKVFMILDFLKKIFD
jgi:hypothetical protein